MSYYASIPQRPLFDVMCSDPINCPVCFEPMDLLKAMRCSRCDASVFQTGRASFNVGGFFIVSGATDPIVPGCVVVLNNVSFDSKGVGKYASGARSVPYPINYFYGLSQEVLQSIWDTDDWDCLARMQALK